MAPKAAPKASPKKAAAKAPKEKKAKDPNAPKRPLSSYMFYAKDKRAELTKGGEKLSIGEIGKATGAAWATLSDKDKKKYEELAAKDKVRYEKEKKAYSG